MLRSLPRTKGIQGRLLPSSAILFLAFFLAPAKAYSCTCEVYGDGSPRSLRHHAKSVFVGEVLEVREATKSEREEYSGPFIVRMRVERYWKGIKSGEINIETDITGCGPYFRVGQKFLVYGMGKRLSTACSGTRKLEDAKTDLQALGPSKEFKPK
jgi:hypothetical protein